MTVRHVQRAASEHRVPFVLMVGLWTKECSLRTICPREISIDPDANGPFQVTENAAERHGCISGWRAGPANADCAARILADFHRMTGSWMLALTAFHRPEDLKDFKGKPSGYAQDVNQIVMRRQMEVSALLARN